MSRYLFRLSIAVLSFAIGLFGVWASGLWLYLETKTVDWYVPTNADSLSDCKPILDMTNENESVAIYQSILKNEFHFHDTQQYVIENLTTGFPHYEDESIKAKRGSKENFAQLVQESISNVELITLENYYAQNKQQEKMPNFSCPPFKCAFISDKEQSDLFKDNLYDGLRKFGEKYPGSSGILAFSKVGFNNTHTQALVYASRWCGTRCGEGQYYLMRKQNDVWVIEDQMELWVS